MKTKIAESDARYRSERLSVDDVENGSPEKAYMGARRMKGLWNSRSHDLDSWRTSIDWIAPLDAAKAWERLPDEENPYGTARAFIEAVVHPDYEKLFSYVEIMLGVEWAKRIADNYADGPGPTSEAASQRERDEQGRFIPNSYAHNDLDSSEENQRGTSKPYLLERLPESVVAEIGEGKKYKTVHEAARKTGVINVPLRYSLPSDSEAAGRYLAERVDEEWFLAMADEYMKVTASQ